MNISEFVTQHSNAKPNAEVVERWEKRVVAQGLHVRGAAGAESYIGQYLKGAKAPKVIGFARIAEIKGFPEMSARFWEEAFFLATGERASIDESRCATAAVAVLATPTVAESFGQSPQLLVLVTRSEAMQMVSDPAYGVQEKVDGRRALVRVRSGIVTRGNKKGLVAPVPLAIADALLAFGDAVYDGEEVNGVFHVFDLLSFGGRDLRSAPFAERHARLCEVVGGNERASVKVVPLYTGDAKLAFVRDLELRGAEGFVMKRLCAGYESGDAHGDQWKYQFRAQSSFIVGERNGVKESVQIFARNSDGSLRDFGYLTVRGVIPPPGAIVEVEYLYCHSGPTGKLHQSVFKGLRTDADASDCTVEKVKVKGASGASDDE